MATILSAAIPAAAASGLALNVPRWIAPGRRPPNSLRGSSTRMTSARPTTAPPGSPPVTTLASVVRSGVTPTTFCTPPGLYRNPVMISSKISTTPYCWVSRRISAWKPGARGTVPQDAPDASRITAAMSGSLFSTVSTLAGSFAGTTTVAATLPGRRPRVGGSLKGACMPTAT